jgi:predicted nuclease of predicted toxin-antitoxin system
LTRISLRDSPNKSPIYFPAPFTSLPSAVGLGSTSDAVIWEYAGANGFTFLTKDKDFVNLSLTLGSPPKVVLLQTGNCSTSQIERIIRSNAVRFSEFGSDRKRSLLLLR